MYILIKNIRTWCIKYALVEAIRRNVRPKPFIGSFEVILSGTHSLG